jgi:adenosine deaminase
MTDAHDALRRMPKTELHVHLEGTVTPETLWALARRRHVALPAGSLDELRRAYDFGGFDDFIRLWTLMHRCLRQPADFELMADGYLDECRRRRIRYAEAHFTVHTHERFTIGAQAALDAVARRFTAAEAAGGPVVRLVLDINAQFLDESGEFTVSLLEREAHPLVVALGLGGPEVGRPRRDAAPYFERARRAGYACVAHAGETFGAEHVRQAVEELRVARVQHGVRAAEDPRVVALLAARGVCCDVALSSNQALKVTPHLAAHPLPALLRAGVPVTLSTDDPPFFATDLEHEYEIAHVELGLSAAELWQVNLNGLRHGLADVALRRRLMLEFEREGATLGLN